MTVLLNDSRFFEEVLPFIGDKNKIIDEIIENSARAGASKVDIQMDNNKLVAVNDGQILDVWASLLTVASTGHSDLVVKSQLPAGMGIMLMLSATDKAVFHSGDKRLEVNCKEFFSSEYYREVLAAKLDDPASMVVDEFVDGMRCEFTQSGSFFKSLLKSYLEYPRPLADFNYYPIKINFNDHVYGGYEHKWLIQKEGSGHLEGATIGVDPGNHMGAVYWFGKKIECKELTPFKVVVNDSTPLLKPTLPDRKSMSNDMSQLETIKRAIEAQLHEEIKLLFNDVNNGAERDEIKKKHLNALSVLLRLNQEYDVEHFQFWAGCCGTFGVILTSHVDDVGVFVKDPGDFSIDGDLTYIGFFPKGVENISMSVGKCKLPKVFANKLVTVADVDYTEHEANKFYNGGFGDAEVVLCSKLKCGAIDVPYLFDSNDCVLYLNPELDSDDWNHLVGELLNFYCDWETRSSRYDYHNDWDEIQRTVNGKINPAEFIKKVFLLAGSPSAGLSRFEVDVANKCIRIIDDGNDEQTFAFSDDCFVPDFITG